MPIIDFQIVDTMEAISTQRSLPREQIDLMKLSDNKSALVGRLTPNL